MTDSPNENSNKFETIRQQNKYSIIAKNKTTIYMQSDVRVVEYYFNKC